MTAIIAYRYDNQDYADGQVIHPRGDSFASLTNDQKTVELAIRAAMPNGETIRGGSLYTWEDRALALRLWKVSRKTHLYELEIDPADVLFKGDLNNYSAAVDAAKAKAAIDDDVARYCRGEIAPPPWAPPRVEILVKSAKVRCKL